MERLIMQLSELNDSELLDAVLEAKRHQKDQIRKKTNRFGHFRGLPIKELDFLVKKAQELSVRIAEIEAERGLFNDELRKHIVKYLEQDRVQQLPERPLHDRQI